MFMKDRREIAPINKVLNELMENWQTFPAYTNNKPPLAIDILDKDDKYCFRANIPGIDPKDIDIEIKENILTIKGSFATENKEDDKPGHFILRERQSGSFARSFTFNEAIVPQESKASFKNGVLEITVIKEKPVEPETYKIAIE